MAGIKLGVIGYGGRISGMIRGFKRYDPSIQVTAVIDPNEAFIRSDRLCEEDRDNVTFYKTADTMMKKEKLDAVAIGTRCNLHTKYAVQLAKYDIAIFLEKPVSVTMKQATDLERAYAKAKARVLVSFPLHVSPLASKSKELITNGEIGDPQHIMAFNYVPYGRVYWEHFYRDYSISGGLFLQKATHDLDYISYLMGKPITSISAMGSFNIFKGKEKAGLSCSKCRKQKSCIESPYNRKLMGFGEGDHLCLFSKDLNEQPTNEDSSSCIFEFDDGSHGLYTQVFFVRRDAGKRGARISGYDGTIEFDWYKNSVQLMKHFDKFHSTYEPQAGSNEHFGGDHALCSNFVEMIKGNQKSLAPIENGIRSVYTCLAARESMKTGKRVKVRQLK